MYLGLRCRIHIDYSYNFRFFQYERLLFTVYSYESPGINFYNFFVKVKICIIS